MSDTVHLKGLNGIRAIAALCVVIHHIFTNLGLFGLDPYIIWGKLEGGKPYSFRVGSFAVTIFFTLSGFLITYLLLKERQVKKINIRNFYLRRILRIWPLYFLVLIATLTIFEWVGVEYSKNSIPYYLLFIVNIALVIKQALPFLDFYWSLCVEEQFYLFWPVFIKFSGSKYLRNSIMLLVVLIILRGAFGILKTHNPVFENYSNFLGQSRFHTMIIGGIAAMLFFEGNNLFAKAFTNKFVVLAAWILIFLPIVKGFIINGYHEIVSVCTVVIIISQISERNRWINLENKVMDFLGRISYGIYMCHVIVIFMVSKYLIRFETQNFMNYILVFVLVVSITILVSTLLYYYFEKIFLNLKKRYSYIEDSGFSKS